MRRRGHSTAEEDSQDPGRAARRDALRWLARRPLTESELRERLTRGGYDTAVAEETLAALRDAGLLNDLDLASNYIVLRAARRSHGRGRLLRELEGRGVRAETCRRAWDAAVEAGDVEPELLLARAVERRVERAGGRLLPREYRRVYNALLRDGHDAAAVISALRPYRHYPDSNDE